ncbi:MAG: acyl-CoA dehydrogenase [Myxococcales bacterium]|nr:acyl-CoA dehydrogenase [Myxococcales bacterium]
MAQAINRYKADLRELQFLLFEQFGLADLLEKPPFQEWGADEVKLVLDEVYRYACEVSGPLNRIGDEQGARLEDGSVRAPDGFADAWKKLYEAGWNQLSADPEYGGQGAPLTLQNLADELISGSNTSFQMYPGLSAGAAELIVSFGTDAQRGRFCANMLQGRWAGTMCLTEAHAGSDVGDCRTMAYRNEDGSYAIKGAKIFISGGDHEMAENVVHMVLARVEGAAKGTKGLSLFIVPKFRVNEDGSLGEPNDVAVAAIEHKMGINGSATCQLNFGDNDGCQGLLCGSVEDQGIRQMFQMMNRARILVGTQGVAAGSGAFLSALEYARERKQGSSVKAGRDPDAPRVPIIEHPDVRRMLIDMKSRIEGARALAVSLTMHADRARALADKDAQQAAYHQGQVDFLVPLYKSYATDQGFQVAATAIQTFGGAGFLKDHPVEQYCRDAKIFSIYEGTNHIQAQDLVGRKLRLHGGQLVGDFLQGIARGVEAHAEHPRLAAAFGALGEAHSALQQILETLDGWGKARELELPSLMANRVLESFAQTAVASLLLEGAVIADRALSSDSPGESDTAFYEGKLQAAIYFARTMLPGVTRNARVIADADRSALEIPDAGFASV